MDRALESLSAFLCDQLERKRLPKPMLALCKYMAELVDEDGYLAQEDLDGLTELKIPADMVERALDTLQSLEPAGVGARDLSECLVLQLSRQKQPVPYAMDIAARFLTELGRGHYGPIAKALGADMAEIQAAEKAIAALAPHPGRAFEPAEPTVYVRPDVFVVELDGELRVVLNEYYLPKISVNPYYENMARNGDDAEARTYLREKLRQTKWLLESMERRGSTLRRCAEAILETQRAFFEGKTTELAPMKLTTLAEALSLHPSTVSRAVRDKYLQCRQGTYPLRYFLNRAVGQRDMSRAGGEAAPAAAAEGRGPGPSPQRSGPLRSADRGGHFRGPPHGGKVPHGAGHRHRLRPPKAAGNKIKSRTAGKSRKANGISRSPFRVR